MRAELKRRIAKVVAEIGALAKPVDEVGPAEVDVEELMNQTVLRVATRRYDDWRHQVLTLPQRLALARDDLTRDAGNRWIAVAARELEIRILEAEEKIDSAEADRLRRNAAVHPRVHGEALLPLLFPIEFDHVAALAEALERCPRIGTMTPAERLELELHDYPHRRKEAEERWANMFERLLPPGVQRAVPLPGLRLSDVEADHRERVRMLKQQVTAHPTSP